MVTYQNTIDVLVTDPTNRLPKPLAIDVSVFDYRMGNTGDWARKWMGRATDTEPYRKPFAPRASPKGEVQAAFAPYSDFFNEQAPRLTVTYEAMKEPHGRHLVIPVMI